MTARGGCGLWPQVTSSLGLVQGSLEYNHTIEKAILWRRRGRELGSRHSLQRGGGGGLGGALAAEELWAGTIQYRKVGPRVPRPASPAAPCLLRPLAFAPAAPAHRASSSHPGELGRHAWALVMGAAPISSSGEHFSTPGPSPFIVPLFSLDAI